MKHAHIAIFSAPGPTHVHPTLSILITLLRRGYRVTYVTSQRFETVVGELGAEVLLCPRIEFPFNQSRNETLPVEQQYSPHIIDLATRTLPLVLPFYERSKPDLILYDAAAYAGLVVAERLGVPTIRISPQFAYNQASLECSAISPSWRASELDLSKDADKFFHKHGVNRSDVIFNMAESTIYFYVDDFQLGQHARDPCNLYAGRCAAERPHLGTWKSARLDDRPSVLISASTVYSEGPDYYRMCLKALTSLHWHTVLAIGGNNDPAAFDQLPPHSEIVQNIPLVLVMPHVDLIVCFAGMTTTMESMYHGLPMVMLTQGHPEGEAYAQNVENLGLGTHLRKDTGSIESITRCVTQMAADPALRMRVQRMQNKVRRSAGAEEVVNWMEERFRLSSY